MNHGPRSCCDQQLPKSHGAHPEVKNDRGHTRSRVSGCMTDFPCPRDEQEMVASQAILKIVSAHHFPHLLSQQSIYLSKNDGPVEDGDPNMGRRWSKTSHCPAEMGRASTWFLLLGKGMLHNRRMAKRCCPRAWEGRLTCPCPGQLLGHADESCGQCLPGSSAHADGALHRPIAGFPLPALACLHSHPC